MVKFLNIVDFKSEIMLFDLSLSLKKSTHSSLRRSIYNFKSQKKQTEALNNINKYYL